MVNFVYTQYTKILKSLYVVSEKNIALKIITIFHIELCCVAVAKWQNTRLIILKVDGQNPETGSKESERIAKNVKTGKSQ